MNAPVATPGVGGVGLAVASDGAGLQGRGVGSAGEGHGLRCCTFEGRSAQAREVVHGPAAAVGHGVAFGALDPGRGAHMQGVEA